MATKEYKVFEIQEGRMIEVPMKELETAIVAQRVTEFAKEISDVVGKYIDEEGIKVDSVFPPLPPQLSISQPEKTVISGKKYKMELYKKGMSATSIMQRLMLDSDKEFKIGDMVEYIRAHVTPIPPSFDSKYLSSQACKLMKEGKLKRLREGVYIPSYLVAHIASKPTKIFAIKHSKVWSVTSIVKRKIDSMCKFTRCGLIDYVKDNVENPGNGYDAQIDTVIWKLKDAGKLQDLGNGAYINRNIREQELEKEMDDEQDEACSEANKMQE